MIIHTYTFIYEIMAEDLVRVSEALRNRLLRTHSLCIFYLGLASSLLRVWWVDLNIVVNNELQANQICSVFEGHP